MLTHHIWYSLNLCVYLSCLQCGRNKRKTFWNDAEETVLPEYPIGTGSSSKSGEGPSFSCMQGEQVSHQMSTLLMPHLSTCEQSVRELPHSLSRPHPFQTLINTLTIINTNNNPQPIQASHAPVSMPTQQPKIFCQQQLQLHLVLTLSLCNYFTSVVISTYRGYVFDSFPLWCVLGCRFIWSFCKEHLFSLGIFM